MAERGDDEEIGRGRIDELEKQLTSPFKSQETIRMTNAERKQNHHLQNSAKEQKYLLQFYLVGMCRTMKDKFSINPLLLALT